ncbi:MAG: hypothetical protein AMJ79_10175 [Phycisphaerae bacterium SM23_30]|nr:MAG: hypothetical protein AMJ79_10175 [Phycisphaerae bacterium SM23_30]
MIAMLFLCMIVGAVTFYLVFKQGLFSTVIMAALTLVAAMITFDYYEILDEQLKKAGLAGYPTKGGVFLALFIISLLLLRVAFDELIKGNMKFPLLIDRVGSAGAGLIASLVMAGMVAFGFQLLPIPAKFLGYDRFPERSEGSAEADLISRLGDERGFFPYGDGLVFSLVKHASTYSFAGKTPLGRYHPDLQRELYLNRLLLSQERSSRVESTAASMGFEEAWLVAGTVIDSKTSQEVFPQPGEMFLAVRINIRATVSNKDPGAKDADGMIRYVLSSFRLVGYNEAEGDRTGLIRYPVGFFRSGGQVVDRAGFDDLKGSSQNAVVELLFAWPRDLQATPPQFIEFKCSSRAKLPSPAQLEKGRSGR